MFSLLKGIWIVLKHSIRRRETVLYPEKSLLFIPDGGVGLYCHATLMARSAAWRATYAQRHVRLIAFPYKLPRTNMGDVTRSFSELIFHVVSFVASVKKLVLHTRYS